MGRSKALNEVTAPGEEPVKKLAPCFVMKMTEGVAAALVDKESVKLRLHRAFPVGARLFLQAWAGGATGRADLCMIEAVAPDLIHSVARRWGWHQGKQDDALQDFGYEAVMELTPILTFENLIVD